MKRIHITGGAGFIGSHLANRLCNNDFHIKVIDNYSSGSKNNLSNIINDIELYEGDIRDEKLLNDILHNVEVIFHMAAIPSVSQSIANPYETHDVNVNGTLSVLNAAVKNNVQKVILSSSCAIYGESKTLPLSESCNVDPQSPYALSKYINEHYCKLYNILYKIETICLRYFNVYGPRQDINSEYSAVIPLFINAVLNNKKPIIYGDGKQTRDFIFVEDVVRANTIVMNTSQGIGEIYNVGTQVETSLMDLIYYIEKIIEKKIKPKILPHRLGDIYRSYAKIEKIKNVLSFKINYDMQLGIKKTIEYYKTIK